MLDGPANRRRSSIGSGGVTSMNDASDVSIGSWIFMLAPSVLRPTSVSSSSA